MNVRRIHDALDISSQLEDLSIYIISSKEKAYYLNELYKMNILCLYKINNTELALKSVQDLIDNSADCRAKRTPVPYSADSLRHN